MKLHIKILLYTTIPLTTSIQCSEVIIRRATEADLSALNEISHNAYHKNLKPLLEKHYATSIPPHQTIDDFVTNNEKINNTNNAEYAKQQKNNTKYGLLLAKVRNKNNKTEHTAGFCRFEKRDNTTMYIRYIIVDEQFRRQGIAKQLIEAALQVWNSVTSCKFHILMYHPLINKISKKDDCKRERIIALDFSTKKINPNSDTPKTHYEYIYTKPKDY